MSTKTYTARQVTLTWGAIIVSDGAPSTGTFLTVAPSSVSATMSTFKSSGGVISIMTDLSGTVTAVVAQASEINTALSDAMAAQRKTGTPSTGPLLVKDLSGTTLYSSQGAVLEGLPSDAFAEASGTREWKFLCLELAALVGEGNAL